MTNVEEKQKLILQVFFSIVHKKFKMLIKQTRNLESISDEALPTFLINNFLNIQHIINNYFNLKLWKKFIY